MQSKKNLEASEKQMNKIFDLVEIQNNINAVKKINLGVQRYVYIVTFGCQQNESDTEKLFGIAKEMGYEPTDSPLLANLIVLNTCAVRAHAEDKALSMLGSFKSLKKKRDDLIIGVVGCMSAQEHKAKKIKEDFHYVDFTLEPSELHRFAEAVYKAASEKKRSFFFGTSDFGIYEGIAPVRKEKHRGLVSIMYGCDNFCSYCIVPYTRGRERSRPSSLVIEEVKSLVLDGVREIMLLGQNVNSYKSDIDFPTLLSKIAEIEGDFLIRFMTSHPKDATDGLIEVMAKYTPKIAPFFHLPLQSGSDRILSLMNRKYTRERYLSVAKKIKEKIPSVALSTDIIVGFPGESEEDFSKTLSVLSEIEFDLVYAFIYSKREGTRAATLEDGLSREEKSERLSRLLSLQDEISKRKNKEYLDTTRRVLIDSQEERAGKRIVTGKTLTAKPVHIESKTAKVGEFINVKITEASVSHLFGEEI